MNNFEQIKITDVFTPELLDHLEKAGNSHILEKHWPSHIDERIETVRQQILEIEESISGSSKNNLDFVKMECRLRMKQDLNRACPEMAKYFN